ncbi:MAG: hypothetical protein IPN90_04245 [Elusimicrobia bacterium]|nr:hypothetical protein [Elusimicrobiota bacterium]
MNQTQIKWVTDLLTEGVAPELGGLRDQVAGLLFGKGTEQANAVIQALAVFGWNIPHGASQIGNKKALSSEAGRLWAARQHALGSDWETGGITLPSAHQTATVAWKFVETAGKGNTVESLAESLSNADSSDRAMAVEILKENGFTLTQQATASSLNLVAKVRAKMNGRNEMTGALQAAVFDWEMAQVKAYDEDLKKQGVPAGQRKNAVGLLATKGQLLSRSMVKVSDKTDLKVAAAVEFYAQQWKGQLDGFDMRNAETLMAGVLAGLSPAMRTHVVKVLAKNGVGWDTKDLSLAMAEDPLTFLVAQRETYLENRVQSILPETLKESDAVSLARAVDHTLTQLEEGAILATTFTPRLEQAMEAAGVEPSLISMVPQDLRNAPALLVRRYWQGVSSVLLAYAEAQDTQAATTASVLPPNFMTRMEDNLESEELKPTLNADGGVEGVNAQQRVAGEIGVRTEADGITDGQGAISDVIAPVPSVESVNTDRQEPSASSLETPAGRVPGNYLGEGSFMEVWRDGNDVVKEVKEVVGKENSGEQYRLSAEQRKQLAGDTVKFGNNVGEALQEVFGRTIVPTMRVEGNTIRMKFVEGSSLDDFLEESPQWNRAISQKELAVSHAIRAFSSIHGAMDPLINGFDYGIDDLSSNFRFDAAGNLTAWFDPIMVFPPLETRITSRLGTLGTRETAPLIEAVQAESSDSIESVNADRQEPSAVSVLAGQNVLDAGDVTGVEQETVVQDRRGNPIRVEQTGGAPLSRQDEWEWKVRDGKLTTTVYGKAPQPKSSDDTTGENLLKVDEKVSQGYGNALETIEAIQRMLNSIGGGSTTPNVTPTPPSGTGAQIRVRPGLSIGEPFIRGWREGSLVKRLGYLGLVGS